MSQTLEPTSPAVTSETQQLFESTMLQPSAANVLLDGKDVSKSSEATVKTAIKSCIVEDSHTEIENPAKPLSLADLPSPTTEATQGGSDEIIPSTCITMNDEAMEVANNNDSSLITSDGTSSAINNEAILTFPQRVSLFSVCVCTCVCRIKTAIYLLHCFTIYFKVHLWIWYSDLSRSGTHNPNICFLTPKNTCSAFVSYLSSTNPHMKVDGNVRRSAKCGNDGLATTR
jgi:hypothetical protein